MFGFSSPVTFATTKLSYPLFDAEFDPYCRGFLVVAGGGGENRTGIPNKITLLDVSSRAAISEVGSIDLSTNEDSPQSIASLTTKKGLITFVGVSSSVADQKAGKNEHFCSYDIEFPPRKRVRRDGQTSEENAQGKQSEASITLAGKSSLFKPPTLSHSNIYQRLLRLSPVKGRDVAAKRIGAIATADAAANEIVVFDATTFIPNASSVLVRIDTSVEAEDLDLFDHSEGSFALAYCTNHDVFIYTISCDFTTKTSNPLTESPTTVFSVPEYGSSRPSLRCLRWLSPRHILLLQNSSPGGGAEVQVLQIDDSKGRVIHRHRLPRSVGKAIRLDICCLDADPVSGERQIVVAVAGQDKSIRVLTCDYKPERVDPAQQITKLSLFTVLHTFQQHQQSISKIALSNFFAPRQPETSNMSVAGETQYIHLASISLGYTVSVEALALTSVPTSPSSTTDVSGKRRSPSVRWVLATSQFGILQSWYGLVAIGFVVLVTGIFLQSYMSRTLQTATTSSVAGQDTFHVTEGFTSGHITPSVAEPTLQMPHASDGVANRLSDLVVHLDNYYPNEDSFSDSKTAIHVMAGSENPFSNDVSTSLHGDADKLRAQGAKRFDELKAHEKEAWKKRLSEAGHWSVEEGETVLKGVLFSQWADVVGGAIRDAVLQ